MRKAGVFTPRGRRPGKHEWRVAEILASAGYYVEFIEEGRLPQADIRLNGVEFEIKSPEHFNPNTMEHTIKDALKQSPNIIVDMHRMKKVKDAQICSFLARQMRSRRQIKRMLLITKNGRIIDIKELI